jgi:hypothetical protein
MSPDTGTPIVIYGQRIDTRVRGGGIGASAWCARLLGTGYGKRTFVRPEKALSGSGRSGRVSWTLDADGIYVVHGHAVSSSRSGRAYLTVSDGAISIVPKGTPLTLEDGSIVTA